MRRWLLICRTKIGMSAARTTRTRPTMESTQVSPASGFSWTICVQNQWNPTRIASITHLIGHRRVLKKPTMSTGQAFQVGDRGEARQLVPLAPRSGDVIDAAL